MFVNVTNKLMSMLADHKNDSQPNNKSNLTEQLHLKCIESIKLHYSCAVVISGGHTDGCLSLFLSSLTPLGQQKGLGHGKTVLYVCVCVGGGELKNHFAYSNILTHSSY